MTAPSDTLNVAGIGIGGMGRSNLTALSSRTSSRSATWTGTTPGGGWLDCRPRSSEREGQAKGARERRRRKEMRRMESRARSGWRTDAEGQALHRLPRDARKAEGHRRVDRRDARSHARGDRAGGDGPRQARLRAEAAQLVGRGSARAREEGEGHEDRHPDGQPGPLVRRCPRGERVHLGGRDRRRARSARVDRTVRSATGRRAFRGPKPATAPRRRPTRAAGTPTALDGDGWPRRWRGHYPVAGEARLGSVPRRRAAGSSTTRSITRSTGAAGWTGARARSATWARI